MTNEITEVEKVSEVKEEYNKFQNFIENLIATAFWIYLIIKVFFFDIDTFLINIFFPNTQWIIDYKFFILIGIIVTALTFCKKNYVLLFISFILFYPFILLFWKIPYIIYKTKSWTIAIAIINTIISFFSGFKYNFIIFSITAISFCLLFNFNNPLLLYFLITVLAVTIIIIYIHRFLTIFMPSSMYIIHSKFVKFIMKHGKLMTNLDDEIKNIAFAEMNKVQLQKWTNNLQTIVILNKGCYFLSSRLQDYQKSNLNIIFYLLNLFALLILTIFFFSGMNFALYKIDHLSYTTNNSQSFFDFIYYSFNTIFLNSIPEIVSTSNVAHFLQMLEIIFSFLLITIFTILVFNIKSKKHTDELDSIIQELTIQGDEIESRIQSEFKLSISDAIIILERMKGGLINIIYFLSKNLKPNR